MIVDLNDLIKARFCPLVEAMLFVVVEAISFIDSITENQGHIDQTEINTLEYVRDCYLEKLAKVSSMLYIVE